MSMMAIFTPSGFHTYLKNATNLPQGENARRVIAPRSRGGSDATSTSVHASKIFKGATESHSPAAQ